MYVKASSIGNVLLQNVLVINHFLTNGHEMFLQLLDNVDILARVCTRASSVSRRR
jgi:hypothetical protein